MTLSGAYKGAAQTCINTKAQASIVMLVKRTSSCAMAGATPVRIYAASIYAQSASGVIAVTSSNSLTIIPTSPTRVTDATGAVQLIEI